MPFQCSQRHVPDRTLVQTRPELVGKKIRVIYFGSHQKAPCGIEAVTESLFEGGWSSRGFHQRVNSSIIPNSRRFFRQIHATFNIVASKNRDFLGFERAFGMDGKEFVIAAEI